jgi:hypothetical protein
MTEAEAILVDIAIMKFPRNQPFNIRGVLFNAQIGMRDKYPENVAKEIEDLVLYKQAEIRNILLRLDYLECVDWSVQKDKLTTKGMKAQDLGGHQQYLQWEMGEAARKRIEEFPKKKWYLYEPIKYFGLIAIG